MAFVVASDRWRRSDKAQAEHGQRLVEAFSDARGRTRVVGVQAASQVLQQSFRRLDGGVRVGAGKDCLHPRTLCLGEMLQDVLALVRLTPLHHGGPAERLGHRRLEWLVSLHGAPRSLRSDTGPEFIATALLRWLQTAEIDTAFIDPGKPWQNGTDESFNGTFRNECLSLEWFRNRMEAKIGIERWRRHDNEERPHMSLGALLPEHVDHPARPYAPRHIDRQTLTSELVDDGQALQRPAIRARIEDEVVGPHVIHRGRGQRSRAGREAIRRRGRRRGTCRPAWCHTREARWALIGCPRRARKTRIFRSPYRGYWPASSRMTANAGASRCRSRDTEPSVDRETDTTAHARRLDSPRRRADATCCRRTRAPTIFFV